MCVIYNKYVANYTLLLSYSELSLSLESEGRNTAAMTKGQSTSRKIRFLKTSMQSKHTTILQTLSTSKRVHNQCMNSLFLSLSANSVARN